MSQQITPAGSMVQVGTSLVPQSIGAAYTPTNGSITSAASTVTTGNIALAGNVTVFIFGTYAGVNVTFEVSPDNTNWFAWPMQREQSSNVETSTGVLASNGSFAWTTDAPGFSFLRVRATAWTSGTASVVINPGSYPFMPVASTIIMPPTGAVPTSIILDSVAGLTTEALATTLVIQRGDAAAVTAQTTYAPTTGKTFRLTNISIGGHATATAMVAVKARIRSVAAGTATVTSPIRHHSQLRAPTTSSVVGTGFAPVFLAGAASGLLDVPSGGSLGISHVSGATSYVLDVALAGYEF